VLRRGRHTDDLIGPVEAASEREALATPATALGPPRPTASVGPISPGSIAVSFRSTRQPRPKAVRGVHRYRLHHDPLQSSAARAPSSRSHPAPKASSSATARRLNTVRAPKRAGPLCVRVTQEEVDAVGWREIPGEPLPESVRICPNRRPVGRRVSTKRSAANAAR